MGPTRRPFLHQWTGVGFSDVGTRTKDFVRLARRNPAFQCLSQCSTSRVPKFPGGPWLLATSSLNKQAQGPLTFIQAHLMQFDIPLPTLRWMRNPNDQKLDESSGPDRICATCSRPSFIERTRRRRSGTLFWSNDSKAGPTLCLPRTVEKTEFVLVQTTRAKDTEMGNPTETNAYSNHTQQSKFVGRPQFYCAKSACEEGKSAPLFHLSTR